MTLKGFADPEVRARAQATKDARKKAKELTQGKNKTASANILSRWNAEAASEQEVEAYFQFIDIEEGLQLLAKMRKNIEIAAKALDLRIQTNEADERCVQCGGKKQPNRDWRMRQPKRDIRTGLVHNVLFCSDVCIALYNKQTQGVKAISGQGMTPDMNPENHPRQR